VVLGSNVMWIVEFYSNRCPHCRKFAPEYIRAALSSPERIAGTVRFGAVNLRAFPALGTMYGITSFPWVAAFYQGKRVANMNGLSGAESVMRFAHDMRAKHTSWNSFQPNTHFFSAKYTSWSSFHESQIDRMKYPITHKMFYTRSLLKRWCALLMRWIRNTLCRALVMRYTALFMRYTALFVRLFMRCRVLFKCYRTLFMFYSALFMFHRALFMCYRALFMCYRAVFMCYRAVFSVIVLFSWVMGLFSRLIIVQLLHTYMHTCKYAYTSKHMNTYILAHIHTHILIYTHTHTYTQTHTHTNTHTHTHT